MLVRAGIYYLGEPLEFGPEGSGTADVPITYKAYPNEVATMVRSTRGDVSPSGVWRTPPQRTELHGASSCRARIACRKLRDMLETGVPNREETRHEHLR